MGIVGTVLGFLGRVLRKDPIGRRISFLNVEGPYRHEIEDSIGTVKAILGPPGHNALLVKLDREVHVHQQQFGYIVVLPRHLGYDAYTLTMAPISANLAVLGNPDSDIERENFIGIGTAKLKR